MALARPKVGILSFLLVGGAILGAWSQQKPIVRPSFHVEGRAAAKSLEDLWRRSDLVLAGTVQSARPEDMRLTRATDGPIGIFTIYKIKVDEVFRSTLPQAPSGSVEFRRRGGRRDKGDHILELTDPAYPPFEIGQSFVFFLNMPPDGRYLGETTGGSDSVFEIFHQVIRTNSSSPVVQPLNHLPYVEFKARLNDLKGQK